MSKYVLQKSSAALTASGLNSRQDFTSKLRIASHVTFHEDKDEVIDEGGQGHTSVTPTGMEAEEDAATFISEDNESVYSESSAGISSTTGGNLIGYFGRFKESQSGEVYTSLFPSLQDFKDNIVGCFNIFEETVG